MAFAIILQEEAIDDIQEAYNWYENQLTYLGEEFLEELYEVFDKLKQHPNHYSFIFNEFRSAGLKRFPYRIIYKIQGKKIFINSIRHKRQKPLQ